MHTYFSLIIGAFALLTGTAFLFFMVFSKNNSKRVHIIVSVLFAMTAMVSWLLNFGWIRFIMTLLFIPVIHSIAFIIINNRSASYMDCSAKLKRYVTLSYITYLSGYLLFPDGGDVGQMYLFFGLIRSNTIAELCYFPTVLLFTANIALLVLQSKERKKILQISIDK